METQAFGKTGHNSSRVIFGAAALGGMRQDKADEVLSWLKPAGVNHIDTAASYGESEDRLAPFLAQHRADFFLATKTGERAGAQAREELERSLERMGVDHVDLVQLHNLVEDDEWRRAFAPDGAVAALMQAKDEGLCRNVGVTGHGTRIPAMHIRSLGEADFASVLFPYNFTMMNNPQYREGAEELLALCAERKVAAQTIKAVSRGRWPDGDLRKFSWYEPITDPDALNNAVHYVLGRQQLFLNSTSDARLLGAIFGAAQSAVQQPSDEVMEADTLAQGVTPLFNDAELERI